MQLKQYDKGVFLGFWYNCKKENMFLYLINSENKNASKSVRKVFLMIKDGPGFMGSLSHKVVVALSAR
jgi:hypothetical protein